MADWTVQYPVNFTPTGDTTSQAIEKHINELSNIYTLLNRVRKFDAGDIAPTDPVVGHAWLDTSVSPHRLKIWDGSQWVDILVGDADRLDGFDASQTPSASQIPVLNASGQLQLPFSQTPVLVNGQDLMYRTFYVDAVNGSDSNLGTSATPFKTIKKAIDSVPVGGYGEIHVVGDYSLSDGLIAIQNKTIRIILEGTLTVDWVAIGTLAYPTIFFYIKDGGTLNFYLDSDRSSKIVINPNTTGYSISIVHKALVILNSGLASTQFMIFTRVDNYNPIIISSGFLVSTDTASLITATPPCIDISGHYFGINRKIIVDTANGAGLVYLKDVSWFRYSYQGGLADASGNALTIKDVIGGGALSLNTSGYYKLPNGLIIQWG